MNAIISFEHSHLVDVLNLLHALAMCKPSSVHIPASYIKQRHNRTAAGAPSDAQL